MSKSAKPLERIIIPMPAELLDRIEGFRRQGARIPSRAEAIRELIEAGLAAKGEGAKQ